MAVDLARSAGFASELEMMSNMLAMANDDNTRCKQLLRHLEAEKTQLEAQVAELTADNTRMEQLLEERSRTGGHSPIRSLSQRASMAAAEALRSTSAAGEGLTVVGVAREGFDAVEDTAGPQRSEGEVCKSLRERLELAEAKNRKLEQQIIRLFDELDRRLFPEEGTPTGEQARTQSDASELPSTPVMTADALDAVQQVGLLQGQLMEMRAQLGAYVDTEHKLR